MNKQKISAMLLAGSILSAPFVVGAAGLDAAGAADRRRIPLSSIQLSSLVSRFPAR